VRVNDEVFVRLKGGRWHSVGQPLDPAKYPNIHPDGDLLIGPSGDVVAFQTTYDVVCSPPGSHHCHEVNLKLRLSRLRPGSATWQVAGDTDLASGDAYVLDDQGRLAFAAQTGSNIVVRTQPNFGAPLITITTLPTKGAVGGFGVDAGGTATLLVAELAAKRTVAFVGPLGGGATWAKQLMVADTNISYQPADFKVSASGSAAFVWQAGTAAPATVFAASRTRDGAVWSAPFQVSKPKQAFGIDWLAVASNNQAITTWTGAVGSAPAGFVSIHNPQ